MKKQLHVTTMFLLVLLLTVSLTLQAQHPLILNDTLNIGYRLQERQDKTGAVEKVKSIDFIKGDITSPIQCLQGQVAGVTISKTGGDPSSSYSVRIRGSAEENAATQIFMLRMHRF